MPPTLAAGKTEKAKTRHFGPRAAGTFPILTEAGLRSVNVVSYYAHLGCSLHHRGDLRREMRRCVGIAHAAFNKHRCLLFQNRGLISIDRRRELFRTLILSKLRRRIMDTERWT